jgi:hypothetical protein
MPTARQIQDAVNAVQQIDPTARILRVGPEGVTFAYGQEKVATGETQWENREFA